MPERHTADTITDDKLDRLYAKLHKARARRDDYARRLARIRDMADNWEHRLPATIRTATAAEAVRNAANGDDRPVMFAVTPTPTDDDQPAQQPTAGTREFAERERARMERLYTRETVRAEKAEAAAAVYREDAEHNATRAERAEQRAASMERAMESTAADALKHGGCHRKLMAQCTRAETAEQRRDELAATLFEVLGHFTRKGHPGTPCLESGWVREDTVARWRAVLNPPATEEQQPDAH